MKPVFDNTFSYGEVCVCVCVCVCLGVKMMLHNIRMGGYLMMMLDYKGGGKGGQESGKK